MNKNNNDNNELAKGLGTGLGHIFPSLWNEKTQEEVLGWLDKNSEFAKAAGNGMVDSFGYLGKDQRDRILALAKKAIEVGTNHSNENNNNETAMF